MKLEGNIATENGILIIRMDGRIWKRKQILRGRQENAGYEAYIDAVNQFFEENELFKYPCYHEKVWISFTQHYADQRRVLDVDNMDIKPIIDAICLYLLPDVSPGHCAVMLDGQLDQKEFLEIRIFPYKEEKD